MRTNRKQLILRRTLYALLLVLCALLQHTRGAFLHFGDVHVWLLPAAAVLIAMQEKMVPALLFGALAGVLWDYGSFRADGFFAVWLAFVAFCCSVLVAFWVRSNYRAALLLSGGALALTALFQWICFVVIPGTGSAGYVLFHFSLPCAALSFLFTGPLYWLVSRIAQAFRQTEAAA